MTFNPDELDMAEFSMIYQDYGMWLGLCKMAADLNTDVGMLLGCLQANFLMEAGYWDPRKPSELTFPVTVKLRDLHKNPVDLKQMFPPEAQAAPLEEGDEFFPLEEDDDR